MSKVKKIRIKYLLFDKNNTSKRKRNELKETKKFSIKFILICLPCEEEGLINYITLAFIQRTNNPSTHWLFTMACYHSSKCSGFKWGETLFSFPLWLYTKREQNIVVFCQTLINKSCQCSMVKQRERSSKKNKKKLLLLFLCGLGFLFQTRVSQSKKIHKKRHKKVEFVGALASKSNICIEPQQKI